jgi:hypothetical protein
MSLLFLACGSQCVALLDGCPIKPYDGAVVQPGSSQRFFFVFCIVLRLAQPAQWVASAREVPIKPQDGLLSQSAHLRLSLRLGGLGSSSEDVLRFGGMPF